MVLTTQEGCGRRVIRGGANQAVKARRLFEPSLWEKITRTELRAPSVFCIRKKTGAGT